MDDVFINTLVDNMPQQGHGPQNGVTVGTIIAAQRAINARLGKRLSWRWYFGIDVGGSYGPTGKYGTPLAGRSHSPWWDSLKLIFGEVDNDDDTSSDSVESDEHSTTSSPTEVEISDYDHDQSSSA
ncbi:hypothetical protein Salat_1712500 [Sesamum alatum]|uniref:Uncharacterized protein n=1 Tax=Sesamum alatum TaxID=300844 RepID=A0AAE1Y7M3_9LAMI|nr:hypothetical protein Salat_1712500 [Sesamum alatum]